MNVKSPVKRVIASIASVSLCGCSLAPVWPMAEKWTPPPGYGNVTNCPKWDDQNKNSGATLAEARTYVVCLAQFYADEERNIEVVHNGETISLFGLGTTAGINVIQHVGAVGASQTSGNNQLQRLGIAAGTVLGFNQAVGIDGQHTIYDSGVVALECVMRTDLALDAAGGAQTAFLQNLPGGAGAGGDTVEMAALTIGKGHQLMADVIADAKANNISPFQVATFAQVTGSIAAADAEKKQFESDLAAATDPKVRVPKLMDAAFQINHSLESALYKSVDASAIFDAMKSNIQKLGGAPAKSAQTLQSASQRASTMSSLFSLNTNTSYILGMNSENVILTAALADTSGSQTLTDTYQECITGTSPTPANPKS